MEKENKYEKMNILDTDFENICYEFEGRWAYNHEYLFKVYGLISDRYSIECLLSDLCSISSTSIRYVDLEDEDDLDEDIYFLTIDDMGYITVKPLYDYDDLFEIDAVYIDMDCVTQDIIDFCVNEDMDVTLFGGIEDDFDEDSFGDCQHYCSDCKDYKESNNDELDNSKHLDLYQDDNGRNFGFTSYKATDRGNIVFSYYSNSSLDYSDIVDILSEINF